MVASKALYLSLNEDVEVKAEDTDILGLLLHHFSENHNNCDDDEKRLALGQYNSKCP